MRARGRASGWVLAAAVIGVAAAGRAGTAPTAESAATRPPVAVCAVFARCHASIRLVGDHAVVRARAKRPTFAGIVVRRLGRDRRLRLVGRVPFGPQRAGPIAIPWNLEVAGKTLRPGRHQIILRALDRDGKVIERSRPFPLVIPER
jgi:hypothetical protein